MNKVEIEEFDQDGRLKYHSTIHLIFTDTIEDLTRFTARTVDCYEYDSLGRSSRHLRFHDNLDSAEWEVITHYRLDNNNNVKEIYYEDLTYPEHSFTKTVTEDTINNSYNIDFSNGEATKTQLDSLGRIIYSKRENGEFWKYVYDIHGNQIVFETSESISNFTYDSKSRLKEVIITLKDDHSHRIEYEYDDEKEILITRRFDIDDKLSSVRTTSFKDCEIIKSESVQYWNGFHESSNFETEYWE
ncbi:MAG: hypothetical protein AAF363_19215 [Bacteroidota bacterium]